MNKDKILSSFFCDNSLNELAKSVGEEFLCPVIITDCAFHIVCSYSYLNYADSAYKTAVRHSELSFSACTQIAKELNENKNHFWICIGENNLYVASLSSAPKMQSRNPKIFCFVNRFWQNSSISNFTAATVPAAQLRRFWKICSAASFPIKIFLIFRSEEHIFRIFRRAVLLLLTFAKALSPTALPAL